MDAGGSTLADVRRPEGARRPRAGRRVVLAVLAAVVLAGAGGLLGLRTSTVTDQRGAWTLALDYPRVARAGLDVTWQVRVSHAGGFDPEQPVSLLVTGDWFEIFETQGFHPEPDSTTRDAQHLQLDFVPPASGTELVVDYDAYVQPASQRGRAGEVVLVAGGVERARVSFRTTLLP